MLVLLDRDGVINVDLPTGVLKPKDFVFLPRAKEAIAMFTQAGFTVAVCTNQSAVGRGWMTLETLDQINRTMCDDVAAAGGRIDRIYVATDAPEKATNRRKPGPGMLLEALADFAANPAKTVFIGDALRDVQAAHAAGCGRALVRTGKGAALLAQGIPEAVLPVAIYNDLYTAAEALCAEVLA